MSSPAQSIAESYAEMAEENYRRDGHLTSVLSFYGESTVQVILSDDATANVPASVSMLIITLGACIEPAPTHVVILSEAWARQADADERLIKDPEKLMEKYPRGTLQAMAGNGDTSVTTVLLVSCFSLSDPVIDSCSITVRVEEGGDSIVNTGLDIMGDIPDKVRVAAPMLAATRAAKPDDYRLSHAVKFLAPLIAAVMAPEDQM